MADSLRKYFGLTQERLAAWLGVHRVVLAQAETGQRRLPLGPSQQGIPDVRLSLAKQGLLMQPGQSAEPAPPPLPMPVDSRPVLRRLQACRQQAANLRQQLPTMQARATAFANRLAALPALRAYTGPMPNPAREAAWLDRFEQEAVSGLRGECGPVLQGVAAARLAGLTHEMELLEELLAALPPATPTVAASPATPTT
ncbi:hypothetical protein GCM10022409_24090 [Hymenobacter glaciei]|uniref:HTH cro/C1-type domain-containing protein n=2 Tax=Hymenobacter glaciei TaxID=877209 RepID=A0ABP7U8N4_9BACT